MFSRNMVLQIALSALVFFLVFRLLSFFGLGLILVIGLGVAAWYLITKRPDVLAGWKADATSSRPATPSVTQPEPMRDRPLTHRERAVFDDLTRDYHKPLPEDRSPRD